MRKFLIYYCTIPIINKNSIKCIKSNKFELSFFSITEPILYLLITYVPTNRFFDR